MLASHSKYCGYVEDKSHFMLPVFANSSHETGVTIETQSEYCGCFEDKSHFR